MEPTRRELKLSKKVSDMTPDELRQALLTHELTGIPNRRAYEESEKLPVKASIDADSLKWVNDAVGHKAGDQVLKAIATALNEATPGKAYHISGDEFTVQGADHATVDKAIAEARDRLSNAKVEFTCPNRDKITLYGIGFSHGKGSTHAEADANLQAEKLQREREGLRAARGEQPPTASRIPAEVLLVMQKLKETLDALNSNTERFMCWLKLEARKTDERFTQLDENISNLLRNSLQLPRSFEEEKVPSILKGSLQERQLIKMKNNLSLIPSPEIFKNQEVLSKRTIKVALVDFPSPSPPKLQEKFKTQKKVLGKRAIEVVLQRKIRLKQPILEMHKLRRKYREMKKNGDNILNCILCVSGYLLNLCEKSIFLPQNSFSFSNFCNLSDLSSDSGVNC